MGLPDLEALIERLEQAAVDAREATREAHEAVQALRRAERDAGEAAGNLHVEVARAVDERMGELVADQLTKYGDELRKATHDGYDNVIRQFDRMLNICQYGNEQGRGENIFDRLRARALEIESAMGRPGDEIPDPTLPTLPNRRTPR